MQLIEYNDISKLLDLNIEDKEFDELCLSSAYTEIEKQLGYSLELKERCETKRVKDNRIILDSNFTVDYQNKSIDFVPCKEEDHLIFITYESGYAKETIPADIKEAIIKLFIYKQQILRKMNNSDIKETILPNEVQTIITRYSRKSL